MEEASGHDSLGSALRSCHTNARCVLFGSIIHIDDLLALFETNLVGIHTFYFGMLYLSVSFIGAHSIHHQKR